jgi:RimJ/RimL family protein N-acetyltransferase
MITTPRLRLRPWRDDDLPAFARLNGDPHVMRFMAGTLSREASDALAQRIRARIDDAGYGMWAVEVPGVAPFIGFTGLSVPSFSAAFTPCVELAWRLDAPYWGHGYATEAAHAAAAYGFHTLGLDNLVAFTTVTNQPSRRVMARLGMQHDPAEDFDHPLLAPDHPLRRHVLYRLARDDFRPQPEQPSRREGNGAR